MVLCVANPENWRNCVICGKSFYVQPKRLRRSPTAGRFCSYACAGKGRSGGLHPQWVERIPRTCQRCGCEYVAAIGKSTNEKFCSRDCSRSVPMVNPLACAQCGRVGLNPGRTYCSRDCYRKYQEAHRGATSTDVSRPCLICGRTVTVCRSVAEGGKGKFCSSQCSGAWMSGHADRQYRGGKGGKREDLGGLYVRSRWEANWARYLNWLIAQGEIGRWEFEPDTFEFPVKRGSRFYTPDFKVYDKAGVFAEYHEVKGWMDAQSRTKLDRMARHYPSLKIVVIDHDSYYDVARKISGLIPNWEWDTSGHEPKFRAQSRSVGR